MPYRGRDAGPTRVWRLLFGLALAFWLAAPASAQQSIRPEFDPGQVQRRIPPPSEPASPPPALNLPQAPPGVAGDAALRFTLTGVVIDGGTVFDPRDFAADYESFLAREIGVADIDAILQRITARYRQHGYFLSRAIAPPQPLAQGILRIHIVEGYLARVALRGASDDTTQRLQPYLAELTRQRPLTLATLERAILLITDLPGVRAEPTIAPEDEDEGSYTLTLNLEQSNWAVSAALDNRGPDSLGPWQAQLAAGAHGLLGDFDRLQLGVFTVPNDPHELVSTTLLYDRPVAHDGARLDLSVTRTDLHPKGNVAALDIAGSSMRYVASVSYPLWRALDQSLFVTGALDVSNSEESSAGTLLFEDHLRVLRAGASYVLGDGWRGVDRFGIEASQGIDALGASPAGAVHLSRSNGRADFTKGTASLSRQQDLGGNWSLGLVAAGQKAAQPLLVAEQFALGGSRFGRGYDPAEIVGDDGVAGSAELGYGRAVEFPWLQSYQLYGFYDVGVVWNMGVSDATRRQSLASTGVGLRVALPKGVAGYLEIARPLTRPVAAEAGKPVRVFVGLSAAF